jgi:hypothetical protein
MLQACGEHVATIIQTSDARLMGSWEGVRFTSDARLMGFFPVRHLIRSITVYKCVGSNIISLFGWLVLVCSERRVLLAGYWWLVCSERKVLLAGG